MSGILRRQAANYVSYRGWRRTSCNQVYFHRDGSALQSSEAAHNWGNWARLFLSFNQSVLLRSSRRARVPGEGLPEISWSLLRSSVHWNECWQARVMVLLNSKHCLWMKKSSYSSRKWADPSSARLLWQKWHLGRRSSVILRSCSIVIID